MLIDFIKPCGFALILLSATAPFAWAYQATPPPARRGGAGAGGEYKVYDQATLDAGKRLFSANCAFCHGSSAKGGESGPDLLRSVTVLHDEDGELIGKVLQNGRVDKGMPKFTFTSRASWRDYRVSARCRPGGGAARHL